MISSYLSSLTKKKIKIGVRTTRLRTVNNVTKPTISFSSLFL